MKNGFLFWLHLHIDILQLHKYHFNPPFIRIKRTDPLTFEYAYSMEEKYTKEQSFLIC